MARNKKVVLKAFDYTCCDDFARYLEEMAAKGWHFKEWGVALVFEKGEPEQAVYAVEVFIDGSEQDVRPNIHTLNFADYCEAAGWKLVDARRKFCIFKQVRDDAVPILTPAERVKNAAKAQSRVVWMQLGISAYLLFMLVMNYVMYNNFLTMVFSNTMLVSMAACVVFVLFDAVKVIGFLVWQHGAKKRASAGQYRMLTSRSQILFSLVPLLLACLYVSRFVAYGEYVRLIFFVLWLVIFGGVAFIIAKFRPDQETVNMIQLGSVVVMFVLFAAAGVFMLIAMDNDDSEPPKVDIIPLTYSDLGVDAGECSSQYTTQSSSILGTQATYSLYYSHEYPKRSLGYRVYKTEQQWILDRIWNHELEAAYNADRTDCTDEWGAESAYRNHNGGYYIRYVDAILILHPEDCTLTQQQIDTVRDLLELR